MLTHWLILQRYQFGKNSGGSLDKHQNLQICPSSSLFIYKNPISGMGLILPSGCWVADPVIYLDNRRLKSWSSNGRFKSVYVQIQSELSMSRWKIEYHSTLAWQHPRIPHLHMSQGVRANLCVPRLILGCRSHHHLGES